MKDVRFQQLESRDGNKRGCPGTAQQGGGAMRCKKSIFRALTLLPLMGILSLTGYSGVLAATSDANDVYKNKAQEMKAEAIQFEMAASKIKPYEDTKGFRRAALRMAAQEKQYDAKQMETAAR
jgi:hypothetical protein